MRRSTVWAPAILLVLSLACNAAGNLLPAQSGALPEREPEATMAVAASEGSAGSENGPGTTYYIRPDGGPPDACTGLANAPYPGEGLNQPCAWDHPFRALPPQGDPPVPPRIAGGDTLLIGPGSYMMGYGAPGAEACESDWPWECVMPPLPGGPSAEQPTRLLGLEPDDPPELWGTERALMLINLRGSNNVEIGHLELTDHAGCVESHSGGLACERDRFPYGAWAESGIYAEDAANVFLHDLDVHGLAVNGVWAGRLQDWTVERVRIAGNGWAGWDGDIEGEDGNEGRLTFREWRVEWNGCAESYPEGEPLGCWGQTAGGYGDGVAVGEGGGQWLIEDSAIAHNTSDGLDMLYLQAGSSVEIRRTLAAGNAGNQIKVTGPLLMENSIVVGDCGFFQGKPFTHHVDNCRAAGNALAVYLRRGEQVSAVNNTFLSAGDCLVYAELYGEGDGSERVRLRNNIFQGWPDFGSPSEQSCLIYQETFATDPFDIDYSLIAGVKDDACPGVHDRCVADLGLTNAAQEGYDVRLSPGSPAVDAAQVEVAPGDDFDGNVRDGAPDIGAVEWEGSKP